MLVVRLYSIYYSMLAYTNREWPKQADEILARLDTPWNFKAVSHPGLNFLGVSDLRLAYSIKNGLTTVSYQIQLQNSLHSHVLSKQSCGDEASSLMSALSLIQKGSFSFI